MFFLSPFTSIVLSFAVSTLARKSTFGSFGLNSASFLWNPAEKLLTSPPCFFTMVFLATGTLSLYTSM